MFCTKCGKQIEDSNKYCKYCGTLVVRENNQNMTNYKQERIKPKSNPLVLPGILAVVFVLLSVTAVYLVSQSGKVKKGDNDNYIVENEQTSQMEIDSSIDDIKDDADYKNVEEIEDSDEIEEIKITLEDYCNQLSMISLEGKSYRHELREYIYEGFPLQNAEGVFKTKIFDMDNDGENELLAFRINQVTNVEYPYSEIHANVYELSNNVIEQRADAVVVSEIFGGIEDYGEIRISIKDNRYICTDHVWGTGMEGDGMDIDMQLWEYNGNELVFCTRLTEAGSDWYETHLYCKDISPQLRAAGFTKTIDQIYKYGIFSFSMAETGMQTLCKLYTTLDKENWYETNATVVNTIIHYIDENPETDYYFADSAYNRIDEIKLSSMSKENLRIARNEIFARYSYVFNDKELQKYFESKAWYISTCSSLENPGITILNDIEKDNTDLIKKYE